MQGSAQWSVIRIKTNKITNNMKRAFKTICIFLSAIFLLTACSDDDDEYHHFLSGTTVDGSETFNFSELEIIGLNRENLGLRQYSRSHKYGRLYKDGGAIITSRPQPD